MRYGKGIYLAVTADEFEHILILAQSAYDLAKKLQIGPDAVYKNLKKNAEVPPHRKGWHQKQAYRIRFLKEN